MRSSPISQIVYLRYPWGMKLVAVVKNGITYKPHIEACGKRPVILFPSLPAVNPNDLEKQEYYHVNKNDMSGSTTCVYINVPETDTQIFKQHIGGIGVNVAVLSIDKLLYRVTPEERIILEKEGWEFKPVIHEERLYCMPVKPYLNEHAFRLFSMTELLNKLVPPMAVSYDYDREKEKWFITAHSFFIVSLLNLIERNLKHRNGYGQYRIVQIEKYDCHKYYTSIKGIGRVKFPYDERMPGNYYWWVELMGGRVVRPIEPFDIYKTANILLGNK